MNQKNQTPAKAQTSIKVSSSKLSLSNPEQVMQFGKTLNQYIINNNLSCQIQGKNFAYADGWKFALINFGLTPVVKKPVKLDANQILTVLFEQVQMVEYGKPALKIKPYFASLNRELALAKETEKVPFRKLQVDFFSYECECEILMISNGKKIGYGHAICSNAELKKVDFDEYAIASMAQTRSIAKAAKNLIGFVMNAAGFETTPAEEMEEKYMQNKEPFDNATADIEIAINDCKTIPDLTELWNKNPQYQNDKKIMTKFTKRRELIQKNAK